MRKELFPFYREGDRLACKQKTVTGCKKPKQILSDPWSLTKVIHLVYLHVL